MKKLAFREVKWLLQDHTAGKEQRKNFTRVSLLLNTRLLPHVQSQWEKDRFMTSCHAMQKMKRKLWSLWSAWTTSGFCYFPPSAFSLSPPSWLATNLTPYSPYLGLPPVIRNPPLSLSLSVSLSVSPLHSHFLFPPLAKYKTRNELNTEVYKHAGLAPSEALGSWTQSWILIKPLEKSLLLATGSGRNSFHCAVSGIGIG